MEIFKELTNLKNVCLGLGFFDGVHKGHSDLIKKLVSKSNELHSKSCIITFQKSPAEMFYDDVSYLTNTSEKEKLISGFGVDYLIELDFKSLMMLEADEYLKKIIYDHFEPKYIISGFNHTFGKNKSGDSEFLEKNKSKYGYIYEKLPPVMYDNTTVSSTLIKKYIETGDIEKANNLLGHNFTIEGIVIEGNRIGRTIGFPTANIIYPSDKVQLPFGVYCTEVEINKSDESQLSQVKKGILNWGIKPTINNGKTKPVAEVHIMGFNEDIYGKSISISILKKIRDERRFESVLELKHQIQEDLKLC